MRKCEREMCDAVHNARNWKGKNTRVCVETDADGIIWRKVYLHGNCIYMRSSSVESFNLAVGTRPLHVRGYMRWVSMCRERNVSPIGAANV